MKNTTLPGGTILREPKHSNLPKEQRHFLLYIPWDNKYLSFIPDLYKEKFLQCLSELRVRTTDVHVAVCFRYFDKLLSLYKNPVIDKDIVAWALILHDIGWIKLSEEEIAASLGVKGLKLNAVAIGPKEKHAVLGEKIAREKLVSWGVDKEKAELVCQCVRWHDFPDKVMRDGKMPPEVQLLVDLDHIWSFTQENFWQDTLRKGVSPTEYATSLEGDLEEYFVTDAGKELARRLLTERKKEVVKFEVERV